MPAPADSAVMTNVQIQRCADASSLAAAVAEQWFTFIDQAGAKDVAIALSGGRIAGLFFQALVRATGQKLERWNRVHIFWVDERAVPPNDPESNFALTQRFLLSPLGIPGHRVHRIRGEVPPEQAAALATTELRRVVPADADGYPRLDLVFLGLGEDGHTASLFPGHVEPGAPEPIIYRGIVDAPKPPPQRVTLSYEMLYRARRVDVLTSGEGKKSIVMHTLNAPETTPLGKVLLGRKGSTIWCDFPVPELDSGGKS